MVSSVFMLAISTLKRRFATATYLRRHSSSELAHGPGRGGMKVVGLCRPSFGRVRYRQIPSFSGCDFEAQEPTNDELEALRASIEKAAQQRQKEETKRNQQDAGCYRAEL